ncbi:histidine protein methyltransferase 1 homolog [Crassostrea virginica]|uniref:protein-histidine N-methyltransferase n=1 Tax=Crassostrea virginica TaxID=6565 RepID=A0A8B8DKS6_CRAVI|nr:histidine protein methyltransferase 1 homolog [Crassostrea virginica]
MEFKFNFSGSDSPEQDSLSTTKNSNSVEGNARNLEEFQELFADFIDYSTYTKFGQRAFKFNNVDVNCYKIEDLEEWILDKNSEKGPEKSVLKSAAVSHSDLVPDVYEGGLTVWECGCDLAEYIAHECIDFTGKSVMELGCGAALPGICAMKLGAERLYVQDYNSEVISYLTIPNVQDLNKTDTCQCRFFSGDWAGFQQYAESNPDIRFDYILTAETIYNTENYLKLHDLMKTLLKDNGTIYVAAKSNYYGVGGGTGLFEEFVRKRGYFSYKSVRTIEAGVPREIIKMEKSCA